MGCIHQAMPHVGLIGMDYYSALVGARTKPKSMFWRGPNIKKKNLGGRMNIGIKINKNYKGVFENSEGP